MLIPEEPTRVDLVAMLVAWITVQVTAPRRAIIEHVVVTQAGVCLLLSGEDVVHAAIASWRRAWSSVAPRLDRAIDCTPEDRPLPPARIRRRALLALNRALAMVWHPPVAKVLAQVGLASPRWLVGAMEAEVLVRLIDPHFGTLGLRPRLVRWLDPADATPGDGESLDDYRRRLDALHQQALESPSTRAHLEKVLRNAQWWYRHHVHQETKTALAKEAGCTRPAVVSGIRQAAQYLPDLEPLRRPS